VGRYAKGVEGTRAVMKVVVQRVSRAHVSIDDIRVGSIGPGLCLFLGIGQGDNEDDVDFLVRKVSRLRIFSDESDKMTKSVMDIDGEVLVVSQFTLYGNCRNGCRPDFTKAAPPSDAEPLYDYFLAEMEHALGKEIASGQFRKMMDVSLVNDGPVTLVIES